MIISDWQMPGLSGSDLCHAVRSEEFDGYTYFILVSSHDTPEDTMNGMFAGADDYLVKPLRLAELRPRLIAGDPSTSLHSELDVQRSTLKAENRKLATAASVDPLTGLGNRRSLDRDLNVLAARVERYGHSYCVSLMDIDHFKSFNDRYGHPAGDRALRCVANQLRGQARSGDSLYRYGGDDFGTLSRAVAGQSDHCRREDASCGRTLSNHPRTKPFGSHDVECRSDAYGFQPRQPDL